MCFPSINMHLEQFANSQDDSFKVFVVKTLNLFEDLNSIFGIYTIDCMPGFTILSA